MEDRLKQEVENNIALEQYTRRENLRFNNIEEKEHEDCKAVVYNILRRIYTTFILSTALLNFGTRANNIGHGPLDFCRVKANFSARVPKNLGGPRPPREVVSARLKRGLRAEIEVFSSPESSRL